jgi:hypothetical protein
MRQAASWFLDEPAKRRRWNSYPYPTKGVPVSKKIVLKAGEATV